MSYYKRIEHLRYEEFVEELTHKYGVVRAPYYTKGYFRAKDSYATENGLYVHHIHTANGLQLWKKSVAMEQPYELQAPSNLVYCSLVEKAYLYVLFYEKCLINGYLPLYGEAPKIWWLSKDILLNNTTLTEEELEIVIHTYIREVAFAKEINHGVWGGDLTCESESRSLRFDSLTYTADKVKTNQYASMYDLIYAHWKDKEALRKLMQGIDVAEYYFSQQE